MKPNRHRWHVEQQRGAAAIVFAFVLPVMIGFVGLAVDLAYIYARQTELQLVADDMALIAARRLNGTKKGVDDAVTDLDKPLFIAPNLRFGTERFVWNTAALQLASRHDAAASDWKPASTVSSDADAAGLVYARIDTSALTGTAGNPNSIEAFFMSALLPAGAIASKAVAIAGPATVPVTPLAVCALDPDKPVGGRANTTPTGEEKIEYGFRRGVSYNLLDLSPNSVTPQAYLVNPLDSGTGASNPLHFGAAYVAPFFCTGTVRLPLVRLGSKIHIVPMPALPLASWLNSRFVSDSASGCNSAIAPIDYDIREYTGGYANWYMSTSPYPSTAASTDRNAGTSPARVTMADLNPGDTSSVSPTVESFGPLWVSARPENMAGTPFDVTDWEKLYSYGGVSVPNTTSSAYGTPVPYGSALHRVPGSALPNYRRILNIPLLNCSAGSPASPATVLGVAKFFMTAKASASPAVVPGEFGGMVTTTSSAVVALYK